MERNTLYAIVAVAIIASASAGAIFITLNQDERGINPLAGETMKDGAGRDVVIPSRVNSIVTFGGVDSLRFVSYLNLAEKVTECDKGDVTDPKNGRAYSYAYSYDKLTKFHADGALSKSDVDRLVKDRPDVVIVSSHTYGGSSKANFDIMAKELNVFVLRPLVTFNAFWDAEYRLNGDFVAQITDLGKFLGVQARAAQLVDQWNEVLADIRTYVTGPRADLRTYVSGLTYNGSNELTATFPYYSPLELIGESNVVPGDPGRVNLTVEEFGALDFNTMVVDPSSSNRLSTFKSQKVMENIYMKNSDGDPSNDIRIYAVMPIVWDGCNWDCALLGAYYMVYLYYGSLSLEHVKEKINAGFEKFYGDAGKSVLSDMTRFFDIKSSGSGSSTPLLGEMTVKHNSDVGQYYFAAA